MPIQPGSRISPREGAGATALSYRKAPPATTLASGAPRTRPALHLPEPAPPVRFHRDGQLGQGAPLAVGQVVDALLGALRALALADRIVREAADVEPAQEVVLVQLAQ